MTNKQIENRIKNLEEAVFALARKMHVRDNANESKITDVNSDLNTAEVGISELEDLSYSQELRITCLELGMDISELESM